MLITVIVLRLYSWGELLITFPPAICMAPADTMKLVLEEEAFWLVSARILQVLHLKVRNVLTKP